MIKKLRRRFVALSMTLVSVVVVFFYIFTTGIFFFRITEDVRNTLQNYSSESYFSKYFRLGGDDAAVDGAYAIDANSVCVVRVSDDGAIAFVDAGHAYMENAVLQRAVNYAMNADPEFGSIGGYNLFYYRTATPFGYRIAFADASRYLVYIKDIFLYDAAIFLVVLLVLWFLNKRLSAIFIKPVERAWTQQQNFISDASHELKTPLTVILANCNILQAHRQNTVEEQLRWVESTNEEAVHMKDLVDKMLYLAKTENMRPERVYTPLDLSDLATRLVLQFEPVAFEKGVTLESALEPGVRVLADPTAVNQIIHILIDNAVKYAGLGGTVRVAVRRSAKHVYLSANNTGEPISPEDLPHIFERFYRSDKARTAGSGYGLGLAICKTLAESQNAEISVQSDETSGTTFTVRFRRRRRTSPAGDRRALANAPAPREEQRTAPAQKRRGGSFTPFLQRPSKRRAPGSPVLRFDAVGDIAGGGVEAGEAVLFVKADPGLVLIAHGEHHAGDPLLPQVGAQRIDEARAQPLPLVRGQKVDMQMRGIPVLIFRVQVHRVRRPFAVAGVRGVDAGKIVAKEHGPKRVEVLGADRVAHGLVVFVYGHKAVLRLDLGIVIAVGREQKRHARSVHIAGPVGVQTRKAHRLLVAFFIGSDGHDCLLHF